MPLKPCVYLLLLMLLGWAFPGLAAVPDQEVRLVIKSHLFYPQELVVKAGVRIKLVIHNQDPTPEEFESLPLNREKLLPGHSQVVLYLGPLQPGVYRFFGEFHPQTLQGQLRVEE